MAPSVFSQPIRVHHDTFDHAIHTAYRTLHSSYSSRDSPTCPHLGGSQPERRGKPSRSVPTSPTIPSSAPKFGSAPAHRTAMATGGCWWDRKLSRADWHNFGLVVKRTGTRLPRTRGLKGSTCGIDRYGNSQYGPLRLFQHEPQP